MPFHRYVIGLAAALLTAAALPAQPSAKPLVVVLVGPPASGKSTQADYLKKKYKLPIISVEHLVAKKHGPRASGADLKRDDPSLDGILKQHLESIDPSRGFVLDGYPSVRRQADFLASLIQEMKLPNPIVIQIHIPDSVAHERALRRGGIDDKPEIIARRLRQYHQEMDMLRAYYPKADIWTIDGTRPPKGVSATIRLLIEQREE